MKTGGYILLYALYLCFGCSTSAQPDDIDEDSPLLLNPYRSQYICGLPTCSVPSIAQLHAPGIGIALEMSYGTVVVRYHNGTYQPIARIDGDEKYVATMRELALGPKERIPYRGPSNSLEFFRRYWLRKLKKALGLPATHTTAVLAAMVDQLRAKVTDTTGLKVSACVLSSPEHFQLRDEEIADILGYLGISKVLWGYGFGASTAAYAGDGQGLCQNYTNIYACEEEEYYMTTHHTLHLDLSSTSLSGTAVVQQSGSSHLINSFIDPDLGTGQLEDITHDEGYWDAISSKISEFVQTIPRWTRISYLLITGNSASSDKFRAAVRDALSGTIAEQVGLIYLNDVHDEADLVFLSAKGAAEVAKRRLEGPIQCKDKDGGERRRREHERQDEVLSFGQDL